MKFTVRLLVAAAVFGLAPPVFAQDTSTSALLSPKQVLAQEQLVRELLQRLDMQDAANAELRRRVAALEALIPPSAPSPLEVQAAPDPATMEEAISHLEERADALPKINGFYDLEFFKDSLPGTFNEFRQHHLFLDFSKEYQKFRVLGELEFEYATLLEVEAPSDDLHQSDNRGEVSVEQAWAEYIGSDAFTVRAGLILTPNYWNVNHYPNTVASTRVPLMVRHVFPESFVGLMAYGTKYSGSIGLGYEAYVSNGEGALFGQHDDNSAKAVGGALKFGLPTRGVLDTFKFNVTGYVDTPAHGQRTRTWGLESQMRRGPFELLFEFARRRAVEDRRGEYLQPSYRLTDRLTAFYRYDRLFTGLEGETRANTWGVNLLPIAPVKLKFEFFRTRQPGTRSFNGVASSLAVAF